jgi:hypothetical protein
LQVSHRYHMALWREEDVIANSGETKDVMTLYQK